MSTSARLQEYYDFDQGVVDVVAEIADEQMANTDHAEFLTNWVLGTGTEAAIAESPVLDIRPNEHDPKSALMIHLAMGQPLDPNNLYQIAAIASANPDTRILTAGNPSSSKYYMQQFTRSQRKMIANGDFTPMNEELLDYAELQGIEIADQYGYSFGTEKAMNAAKSGRIGVSRAVVLEPVAVKKRSLVGLGIDFARTGGALKGYVEKSGPAFLAARKESVTMMQFNASLARLSNLAVSRGLAKGEFEMNAESALYVQEAMELTMAWGGESELAIPGLVHTIADNLQAQTGRVSKMELPGQKHALANDVWLQAAIVTQGLK